MQYVIWRIDDWQVEFPTQEPGLKGIWVIGLLNFDKY